MLDENQLEIVNSNEKNIIVEAGAGSGKALLNGSKVMTPNGYKKIEDLKINDEIFGSDGNIYNVCGVYPQGKRQIYEVEFSDGTIIKCSKDHLWAFQTSSMRRHKLYNYKVDTLENINNKYPLFRNDKRGYKPKNIYIPLTSPLNFSKKKLPIKPYTLGALIGNGFLRERGKSCSFSSNDMIVIDRVNKELSEINYELIYNGKYDYRLKQIAQKKKSLLIDILEDLKLSGKHSWDKFIPKLYLFSNIEDRLNLLQGLIDTDGYFKKGMYEYTTVSKHLAEDVKFLAQSLGLTAKISIKKAPKCTYDNEKRTGRDCYRVYIKTSREISYIHFSNNKGQKNYKFNAYARKSIINIKKTNEYGEMTCIKTTAPNELFLTENLTVTHNTRVLIERIRKLINDGVPPSNIVAISFTNMAAEEMKERLIDVKGIGDCFIGTIHSFANKIFKNSNEDYKIYTDEIENQFMNVLISLYAKNLTMDRYLIYKDLRHKIDLGTLDESELNATMLPSEMFEINTFFGEKTSNEYPQTVKTLCKKHNVITFDELLKRTTEYFKEINGKVEYLFVDEFQDIGPLEKNFFVALNADNYFYVGDEKQSIYAFKRTET